MAARSAAVQASTCFLPHHDQPLPFSCASQPFLTGPGQFWTRVVVSISHPCAATGWRGGNAWRMRVIALNLASPPTPEKPRRKKHHFRSKSASDSEEAEAKPRILRAVYSSPEGQERFREAVELLGKLGLTEDQASRCANWAGLSATKTDTLVSKLETLKRLEFTEEELATMIKIQPRILTSGITTLETSIDHLVEVFDVSPFQARKAAKAVPHILVMRRYLTGVLEVLRSFGLEDQDLRTVFLRSPRVLTAVKTYQESIRELEMEDFTKDEIRAMIVRGPQILGCNASQKYRDFVEALGKYGVTREQCKRMVMYQPSVVTCSPDLLYKKIDFALKVMGRSIDEIVAWPPYLGYSLEFRIKPRFEALKERGKRRMPLSAWLTVTDRVFRKRHCNDEPVVLGPLDSDGLVVLKPGTSSFPSWKKRVVAEGSSEPQVVGEG